MGVRLLSRCKGGDLVEQYQVGKVYQIIPGLYVRYEGNGLYTGVENPNAAAEAPQALKDKLGVLYKRLYDGDKTVIPEIEKISNSKLLNKSAYDSYIGSQDQLDSIINAGFISHPTGYKTKLKEAQGYADQAKVYAQQYVTAKAEADKNGTAISSAGQDALQNMYAWLKKESNLIGGGYNDFNEEAMNMLATHLADGTFIANSYERERDMNRPKTSASTKVVSASNTATTFANAQTYASSGNGMTEAATAAKGTDTDAYSVTNRATTQGMVGFNQGSTYDTDNRSAVQKYSQALQGGQLGTTSSNKSKNTVANRYAVSNIFR